MERNPIPTDSAALADAILAGTLSPSAAIGRPDVYPLLTRNASGQRLPLLGTSAKIEAGGKVGILGAVLYMMPAMASGRNACPHASDGCRAACLAEGTGRMSMSGPQRARRRRHAAFYADRGAFLADLHLDYVKHAARARRMGKVAAGRNNGTTDLPWHRMPFTAHDGTRYASIHEACPDVRFYEYTKVPYAIAAKGGIPANLTFTFSMSERPDAESRAAEWIAAGYGVAVVTFTKRHDVPRTFTVGGIARPTVDGDAHDARFLDPPAHVVILAAKGRAKNDTTGFVKVPA